MSEDADSNESQSVVHSKIEAFAYSSDLFPHHSIIDGYQRAIPDGGKEVISIVKRQQTMTFVYNMATLFSNNLIPFILILPTLLAISAGALIEITIVSAVPIGLFTAGSAMSRVVTTLRSPGAQEQTQLPSPA
ncbi:MAG: hypothetical protein OXI30_14465, partial [Chloroflexota bacterium]|nr:hypothetical protein [Chloroflexota bacterium]